MILEDLFNQTLTYLEDAGKNYIGLKLIIVLLAALAVAYVLNRMLEKVILRIGRRVSSHTDNAAGGDKLFHMRRVETFLSVGIAVGRTIIVFAMLYLGWRLAFPSSAPVALVGASAFFIVLAGATIGPLLRDLTYGIIMIAEQWYNVGDHISVEPFINMSGVVEQITLRSTKLRSLNGEIIWLHNQHIQGVRVTPRGVRTLAIETFVTDLEQGKKVIEKAIKALPVGPTLVAKQVAIVDTEQLGEEIWRITAIGQTAPGRDWLIEDFAIKAIHKYDAESKRGTVIMHGPIMRYADDVAERRFKRSIRAKA